jgi:hypothetical protein
MRSFILYIAAASTTAIAGMLHLMLGPNALGFNVNQGILFIVGGIAQVFWIIPIIRKWGKLWYAIGIGGTIVFSAIWIITRFPGNPITGRGSPAGNPLSISVEVFEAAFIILSAAIILYEDRKISKLQTAYGENKKSVPEKTTSAGQKQLYILGGIVVALILIGLFALPELMPNPMGGGDPSRQGGGGGPPPTTGGGQSGASQGQSLGQQTSVGSGNST